ncbi:MAG: hypothetical protein QOC92_95 [Acidimicrobiaceae bacterium]|jgi:hypothetical protein
MTVAELSKVLYELDVPSDLYRLDGSHRELATVLARRGSKWVVFLSERGEESDPVEFDNEDHACVYFLGSVCLDLVGRGQLRAAQADPRTD